MSLIFCGHFGDLQAVSVAITIPTSVHDAFSPSKLLLKPLLVSRQQYVLFLPSLESAEVARAASTQST